MRERTIPPPSLYYLLLSVCTVCCRRSGPACLRWPGLFEIDKGGGKGRRGTLFQGGEGKEGYAISGYFKWVGGGGCMGGRISLSAPPLSVHASERAGQYMQHKYITSYIDNTTVVYGWAREGLHPPTGEYSRIYLSRGGRAGAAGLCPLPVLLCLCCRHTLWVQKMRSGWCGSHTTAVHSPDV